MSFIEIADVDLVYESGAGASRSAETLDLSKATHSTAAATDARHDL